MDIGSEEIAFSDCYDGTKVSLSIPNSTIKGNNKIYIRIRLKGNSVKYFVREFTPQNWFFQSAFTSTDAIDFRINEKRNFHNSLAEEINEDQLFNIRKVHFLLMRDAQDDLIADHLKISCRELEVDLWKDYVGAEYKVENIIAYHWSEKANEDVDGKFLESFNTWAKIKYHKSNVKTIMLYLLIIGIMSISFNIISTCITNCIFNESKQKGIENKTYIQNEINENKTTQDKDNADTLSLDNSTN